MYFRPIFLLAGVMSLTCCAVADMDSSNYHYVPWIQLFQKVDSAGQTNIRERKEALYSCGVDRNENLDDKNWGLNAAQGNETPKEIVRRNERIFACMQSKGYKVYGFNECGPIKKPSGLCPN
ncbi:hypothetical protein RI049_16605 [Cedecea neteri]|uniref:hypothetical protein n=1 Tax=Cedecea neteri TaxID=158822 RepID=UPI002AA663ED|nr:hypothetical protein [Cedecea neteri]WPU21676.1 hypothetical protein RI049_16605 [Cedecea neteri]